MKIGTTFNAMLISHKEKKYDVNGQRGTSYSLGIKIGDEIGELPCTREAYEEVALGKVDEFSLVVMSGEYDSNYKRFRVLDIVSAD